MAKRGRPKSKPSTPAAPTTILRPIVAQLAPELPVENLVIRKPEEVARRRRGRPRTVSSLGSVVRVIAVEVPEVERNKFLLGCRVGGFTMSEVLRGFIKVFNDNDRAFHKRLGHWLASDPTEAMAELLSSYRQARLAKAEAASKGFSEIEKEHHGYSTTTQEEWIIQGTHPPSSEGQEQ